MLVNVGILPEHKKYAGSGENVLMVTLGYGILVTVVDLRVLVTLFTVWNYGDRLHNVSMELW